MARVTLFPEDGGVYTVWRAPGLLTQLSPYSPAAPERSSIAGGGFKGQWEQDVILDRRCGIYSYTDASKKGNLVAFTPQLHCPPHAPLVMDLLQQREGHG